MITRGPELAGKPLTAQQQRIAAYVADGLTNDDIGKAMCLSGLTVKSHLRMIFQKTGATSRAHLVAVLSASSKVRTAPEIVAVMTRLRADRAAPDYPLGTARWYRQEGELRLLDELIRQIEGLEEKTW